MNCIKCNLNMSIIHTKQEYDGLCRLCADKMSRQKYKDNNKEKIYASKKHILGSRRRNEKYRIKNRDRIRLQKKKYYLNKMKNNPSFKIENAIRNQIYTRLKLRGLTKRAKSIEYLGCTIDALMVYIEKLFKPGMSWDNYGYIGWHIDHIIPISKFDLTKESERFKCFNFQNLQPLWAEENFSKGNREQFKNYL